MPPDDEQFASVSVESSHAPASASHVAAVSVPALHADVPVAVYPVSHVGWHVDPLASLCFNMTGLTFGTFRISHLWGWRWKKVLRISSCFSKTGRPKLLFWVKHILNQAWRNIWGWVVWIPYFDNFVIASKLTMCLGAFLSASSVASSWSGVKKKR